MTQPGAGRSALQHERWRPRSLRRGPRRRARRRSRRPSRSRRADGCPAPDRAHVAPPVVAEVGRGPASGGPCRRGGDRGRRRRSATRLWRASRWWPIIRRSAGRASISKLTIELTGLPGRPKIGEVAVERAERKRLGRLDRDLHPGHVGDPSEHGLDDVVVAHPHAAARHDRVARRPPHRGARARARPRRHGRCRGRRPRSRCRASMPGEHRALFDSRIWPGASGRPSSTSSSPVDSTATLRSRVDRTGRSR